MKAVLRRPRLRDRLNRWLTRFPHLHRHLFDVARRNAVFQSTHGLATVQPSLLPRDPELAHLTPRAREIHRQLLAAIEKRKGHS